MGGASLVGWLAAGGFVAAALVAAPAHGLAFDSHIWFPFGDRILGWLAGRAPRPFNLLTEPFEAYGSTAALAASATSALLHDRLGLVGPVVGHHAFVVLSGGALVGLAAYLGARVAGARAGALAALLLATAPRFFFEAETNVSDVPAAVAWTAFLVALWHALEAGRTGPLLAAAAAAAALGAVRLTNLLFLPAVPVLWLACSGDARRRAWALVARGPWWRLPLAAATLAAVFVLARPLAWPAPWATLRTVFDRLLVPPYWTSKGLADVFFLGTLHAGGPPSFHPVMLAVTTPLPFLAALAPGLVVLFRRRRAAAWLLVAWIAVVLGRHAFLGRGNYDGVRHVIDAFPALAVLAGVGVEAVLAAAAAGAAPRARAAVWALGTLVAGAGALAIVRLHPYAVAYYNPLVGGLAGAAARFETEYSGVAYREALLWAARELGPEDRLWITRDYDRGLVAVQAAWLGLDGPRLWRPGDAEPAAAPRRLVTMQILRPGPFERPAGRIPAASLPIVYEIRRDGVTLLRAREVPPARRAEIGPGGG